MGKDRSEAERAERKERKRKEKKEHATTEENGVKKHKKEKKSSKDRKRSADAASTELAAQGGAAVNGDVQMDETSGGTTAAPELNGGELKVSKDTPTTKVQIRTAKEDLVPFANPLVEEKMARRLLRGVTQGANQGTLKRGVKEGVKFARKAEETSRVGANKSALPFAVALIAADVSPADVISHLPVLCEDYHIPYIYVHSRRELGQAANTKRPTSIIFVTREKPARKQGSKVESDEGKASEPWEKTYESMVKMIKEAGESVTI